jgi:hypothetical protein
MVWLEVRSTDDDTVRLRSKVYFHLVDHDEDPATPLVYVSDIVSWATQR